MSDLSSLRVLYTAFDEVPSPKGASTHILAMVRALDRAGADVWLVTPGAEDRGAATLEGGLRQVVLGCPDSNALGRVRTFRDKLAHWLAARSFDVLHVRSIFEGIPLLDPRLRRDARLIYEVNGFPSIELKYHYARLSEDPTLVQKLTRQEDALLAGADRILTVSGVNRAAIESRGVPRDRIQVIPNGVDLERFPFQLPRTPADAVLQLCYIGTLTSWQGVEVLIEATGMLREQRPVRLRILGPSARGRRDELQRLVRRLRAENVVEFLGAGSQADVVRLLHESHATAVPLLAVDRNTRQGCCPLKLLEALAAGCPVVASDLPVVREIAESERHLLTVRPNDGRHLKNALARLVDTPGLAQSLALEARGHVARNWTWDRAADALVAVYRELQDLGTDDVPRT